MKTLIFPLMALFFCQIAIAQNRFSVGPFVALTQSRFAGRDGDFDDVRSRQYFDYGWEAGFRLEYALLPWLSLRSGAEIGERPVRYELKQSVIRYEGNYQPLYMEIPLMAQFNARRTFVSLGGYAASGIGGRFRSDWSASAYVNLPENLDEPIRWGDTPSKHFVRSDAGLLAEAGLKIKGIRVGFVYSHGLVNVFPEGNADGVSGSHQTLRISLAYMWGFKRNTDH